MGFSIKYDFGIFRQSISDGWQIEFPDDWLDMGSMWLKCRSDEALEVKFFGNIKEKAPKFGAFCIYITC